MKPLPKYSYNEKYIVVGFLNNGEIRTKNTKWDLNGETLLITSPICLGSDYILRRTSINFRARYYNRLSLFRHDLCVLPTQYTFCNLFTNIYSGFPGLAGHQVTHNNTFWTYSVFMIILLNYILTYSIHTATVLVGHSIPWWLSPQSKIRSPTLFYPLHFSPSSYSNLL